MSGDYLKKVGLADALQEASKLLLDEKPETKLAGRPDTIPKYHFCKLLNQVIEKENEKRAAQVDLVETFSKRLREHGAPFNDKPMQLNASDVLLVIDMQNDFVPADAFAEGCGCFAVKCGEKVALQCAELINAAARVGCTIIASRDYHPIGHCSFNTHKPPGPFPPHCVQGSPGSFFVTPVKKALDAARKRNPGKVHVVFKGYREELDSFGAFQYSDKYAEGRISRAGSCNLDWTGGIVFPCSYLDVDLDAPPDVMALMSREDCSIKKVIPDVSRRVLVCGLALDFCVMDTAINARLQPEPYQNVTIVHNAAAAAFIGGVGKFDGGYLTDPAKMAAQLKEKNISLVSLESLVH